MSVGNSYSKNTSTIRYRVGCFMRLVYIVCIFNNGPAIGFML